MINFRIHNRLFKYIYLPQYFFNILFFFLFSFQKKEILTAYFDSFQTGDLNTKASLIDVTDYYNLSLIITSDNKIYTGIPPTIKVNEISNLRNISSAVTYDENNILIACTENFLLTKINLETGQETPLIYYENISAPDPENICSISYMDDYVYIGYYHMIFPIEENDLLEEKEEELEYYIFNTEENIFDKTENSNENILEKEKIQNNIIQEEIKISDELFYLNEEEFENEEYHLLMEEDEQNDFIEKDMFLEDEEKDLESENLYYMMEEGENLYNDDNDNDDGKQPEVKEENIYFENLAIRVKLNSFANENIISEELGNIKIYNISKVKIGKEEYLTYFSKTNFHRRISCEVVKVFNNQNEQRLVCAFLQDKNTIYVGVINYDINQLESVINFDKALESFLRMQRIDSTQIRFFINSQSYEIYLMKNDDGNNIIQSNNNIYFDQVSAINDLFFYHNQFIFYFSDKIYIRRNITNNYIEIANNDGNIAKLMGYFNEEKDILIFIYELETKIMKYFCVGNLSSIFFVEAKLIELEIKSNVRIDYNITEMITKSADPIIFTLSKLVYIPNTKERKSEYSNYNFDKENQTLTIYPQKNDWVYFDFYYKGETDNKGYSTAYYLENCRVYIKTCLFKCGSCNETFDQCDYLDCKQNFSLLKDGNITECYSNDQNLPNYILNETTHYFEKCYPSCKFCRLNDEFSSSLKHNCMTCNEGYLKSYTYMENCYKIEYPKNNSNFSKIVRNKNDEKYEIVDSCEDINKYKIKDTGECVDKCPTNSSYYYDWKNNSLNFSNQQESSIGVLYQLRKESYPKYLFNKMCYTICPSLTYSNINKCNCSNGWEYNSTTEYMTCYSYKHCNSLDYYYHTDTKECVLYGCKENYYLINYECYPNKCPDGSIDISTFRKECNFTYKFCYIDDGNEKFRNKYSNTINNNIYKYRYNDTNLYFKNCNYSLLYYNITTYLYRNICYEFCPPEETIKNDTNKRCSCLFYIYYVNKEKSDYECLKEHEKCVDFKNVKKYPIIDKEECVDSLQECIDINYTIFNEECFKFCPNRTELKEENSHYCFCKNYYYNESNFLTCFEEDETCESMNFPIKMNNTKECFKTKEECTKRGFKYFNNICYENNCPYNSYNKNNNGICLCSYYFFNQSNNLACLDEGVECKEASSNYPYNYINKKECLSSLDECKNRKLKIFNEECYDNCPKNTESKNNEPFCICSYYYLEEDNKLNCFNSGETCKTKNLIESETKECFKKIEDCRIKGFETFNDKCYIKCPELTEDKNNDNICLCSDYTLIDENNLLKCFKSEVDCSNEGYYFDKVEKKCFLNKEECIMNHKKLFGKECLKDCPKNTLENGDICECSYYFYNKNGILDCFDFGKTCLDEGYNIKSESSINECFINIKDCMNKNYSYFYDNICYKSQCPPGKIPLKNFGDSRNQTLLINQLNYEDYSISGQMCICDTSIYYGWINDDISHPYLQNCLEKCPYNFDLDYNTKKCIYQCTEEKNYIFNNNCYKNSCPEGTKLDELNQNSRICICEDKSEIDISTGLTSCSYSYPDLFYEDRRKCPFVYKNECYSNCPNNTCISPNIKELVSCVDIKPQMKIYRGICIEGIEEYIYNLEYIKNDDDIKPIITPSGVTFFAFSASESIDKLIDKYPNSTFIDLGECKEKLRKAYNLSEDVKLYVLGIDTPTSPYISSINTFNFEVYLKNGTQLKDISVCNEIKLITSSNINDLETIYFQKGKEFSEVGYDIYNHTDIFYTDACTFAQDEGNDITLKDREKYHPNVSICNEGCEYEEIDFEKKRFTCKCNLIFNDNNFADRISNKNKTQNKNDEENLNFLDYCLSFINYKIITCVKLFYQFKNFYHNYGFYIGFTVLIICIVLIFVFLTQGMKYIGRIMQKNIPSLTNLKNRLSIKGKNKNDLLKRESLLKLNKSNIKETIKNNPPPKIFNIVKLFSFIHGRRNSNNIQDSASNNSNNLNNSNNIKIDKNKKKIRKKRKTKTVKLPELKRDTLSSKDNLIKVKDRDKVKVNNEKKEQNRKNLPKSKFHIKPIKIIEQKKKRKTKKRYSFKINRNKVGLNLNKNNIEIMSKDNLENKNSQLIGFSENETELNIDFTFKHLFDINDDEIDKKELNNVPYRQALRIDKRSYLEIFFSVLEKEIEFINLFYYANRFTHYSLSISVYLFELLLDLTLNFLLYTDDVVSEKYHNDGNLLFFSSLVLSFMSNVISSIIVYFISKLTNYYDLGEEIIKRVKYERNYFENILRLFKYIRLRVIIFYILEISFIAAMNYYLYVFCSVYQKSQGSVMINYIIGACTSLAISVGLSIIITLLRVLSFKYQSIKLFNVSKYLYDQF